MNRIYRISILAILGCIVLAGGCPDVCLHDVTHWMLLPSTMVSVSEKLIRHSGSVPSISGSTTNGVSLVILLILRETTSQFRGSNVASKTTIVLFQDLVSCYPFLISGVTWVSLTVSHWSHHASHLPTFSCWAELTPTSSSSQTDSSILGPGHFCILSTSNALIQFPFRHSKTKGRKFLV